jgi:hypothetical protein
MLHAKPCLVATDFAVIGEHSLVIAALEQARRGACANMANEISVTLPAKLT